MPPKGPRPSSTLSNSQNRYRHSSGNYRGSYASFAASELTIIVDSSPANEKVLDDQGILTAEPEDLQDETTKDAGWPPVYKNLESGFQVPFVQTPTAFRTTSMHKRNDSSTTMAVYLPEVPYDAEKAFTRTQPRPITEETPKRGTKFWLCIAALMTSSFLIVLDLVRAFLVVAALFT